MMYQMMYISIKNANQNNYIAKFAKVHQNESKSDTIRIHVHSFRKIPLQIIF